LQAGGRGFESHRLHSSACSSSSCNPLFVGLYGLNEVSGLCRSAILASLSRTPISVNEIQDGLLDNACDCRSAADIDFVQVSSVSESNDYRPSCRVREVNISI
jgi:hypothetical protein